MVKHIILWTLNPELTEEEKQALADEVLSRIATASVETCESIIDELT